MPLIEYISLQEHFYAIQTGHLKRIFYLFCSLFHICLYILFFLVKFLLQRVIRRAPRKILSRYETFARIRRAMKNERVTYNDDN